MNPKLIAVVGILIIAILFSGCLDPKPFKSKDTVFEMTPEELTLKNGGTSFVKIRVANNGNSVIYPVVRFNMNSSDKPYVNFSHESYNLGSLRPGEDSGFRIVDIKAQLAAGIETKYPVRVQVINNGSVLESKDIVIAVTR